MNNTFEATFNKKADIIIGALHFPPLPGYPDYPGFDIALKNALEDLKNFEEGGVDAIFIENNYDIPHTEHITLEAKNAMIELGNAIKEKTALPLGVSVLWNDYASAFEIARAIGGKFIRVPVFVDDVKTNYGIMNAQANNVTLFQKEHGMEDIQIYADIHVKHAEILSALTIEESARLAIEKGADALIVTGKWTGDAPQVDDLKKVREAVGEFPILCGSGVDAINVKTLFAYANGAIVSTSVKEGKNGDHINVKEYEARISGEKVKELVGRIN